ncbi:MAG: ACP S-malonyltransferase [bacterium]|nr:ACP S-malonyltransferase [bacterium]
MKVSVLFPGQGSQYVGMCKDMHANPEIRQLFETASLIINDDIADIMFNGPDNRLTESRNAQVAILLHSYSAFSLIKNKVEMDAVAGHSLGEYTALLASDVFDFETAVKLVRKRGELMSEAGEKAKGSMAAVIGLDSSKIEDAIKDADQVVVANYNGEGQTVISGPTEGIDYAMKILADMGARRVLKLNVSGAFHSPLMNYAYNEFSSFIETFEFKDPKVPVIMNVSANYETSRENIKELLKRQIISPVRWTQIMSLLLKDNKKSLIEAGPSKVLSGMAKKASPEFSVVSVEKLEDINF